MLGLAIGGLYGVQEGMRRNLGTSSFKLRLNSVLNSVTRRGSFLGNSLGVLGEQELFSRALSQQVWEASILTGRIHATLTDIALMYNAVNSTIDAVRGEHDFAGGMAAAAISGAIFKSTGEFGRITIEE